MVSNYIILAHITQVIKILLCLGKQNSVAEQKIDREFLGQIFRAIYLKQPLFPSLQISHLWLVPKKMPGIVLFTIYCIQGNILPSFNFALVLRGLIPKSKEICLNKTVSARIQDGAKPKKKIILYSILSSSLFNYGRCCCHDCQIRKWDNLKKSDIKSAFRLRLVS